MSDSAQNLTGNVVSILLFAVFIYGYVYTFTGHVVDVDHIIGSPENNMQLIVR